MSYAQIIYNRLRQAGMTEAGALGVLGNFDCESNCEPYRLQNDGSSFRTISKAYVNALRTGQLTQEAFAKDGKGFGIAQWTYPARKFEFYKEWKKSGKQVDDINFQLDFAVMEFKRDFSADFAILCKTNNIQEAVNIVCDRFENPKIKNYGARFQSATRIKFEIDLNAWNSTAPEPEPSTPNTDKDDNADWATYPASEYWPPRTICEGMVGKDVVALRSLLYARERIDIVDDDDFDKGLTAAVKDFQKFAFPNQSSEWDGIAGPKTWTKLLERE